ncbi:MAG: TlpA family protein disulfide reductase [Anaerolineae bacterium]|nr:TlpA family protein disulfide reductase [Anaerolineae bacterium]
MKKILILAGALGLWLTAAVILAAVGLPDRADFTGFRVSLDSRPIAPEIGASAPPLDLPRVDGSHLALVDFYGEPVVINFWATWCLPCRAEMPELQQIADQGITVIGVNLGESPDLVAAWIAQLGITYEIVLDGRGWAADDYRLRGQPSTYVVNAAGVITHIFFGAVDAQTLRAALFASNR